MERTSASVPRVRDVAGSSDPSPPCTVFLTMLLCLWPAGILKGSFIKSYAFFAYFAIFRSYAYGTQSFHQVWTERVLRSPVEFLLIAACTFIILSWLIVLKKSVTWIVPFVLYAALMFLTTVRNRSDSATHVSSMLPPLYLACGLVVSNRAADRSKGIRLLVCLAYLGAAGGSTYARFLSKAIHCADRRSAGDVVSQGAPAPGGR